MLSKKKKKNKVESMSSLELEYTFRYNEWSVCMRASGLHK